MPADSPVKVGQVQAADPTAALALADDVLREHGECGRGCSHHEAVALARALKEAVERERRWHGLPSTRTVRRASTGPTAPPAR
jgi:hypothetical protein